MRAGVSFCHGGRAMTRLQRFLKDERERRRLTRQAAEEASGIGSGNWTRLEKDGRRPQAVTFEKLAVFLGVPTKELEKMHAEEDGERTIERPHRYYLVEERLIWARAEKKPQALIDMFRARSDILFKGEPTEADVDEAWTAAERRYKSFSAPTPVEGTTSDVFKVKPKIPTKRKP